MARDRSPLADIEFGPSQHLLEVRDLAVEFNTDYGNVHAVNGINYTLDAGKSVTFKYRVLILSAPPSKERIERESRAFAGGS